MCCVECLLMALLVSLPCAALEASSMATRLFDTYRSSVYQVQVIDNGSSSKSSIGSGFLLNTAPLLQSGSIQEGSNQDHDHNRDNVIVTNYHVVSAYVENPDEFQIRVLDQRKGAIAARVVNFDVIHDLAILALDRPIAVRAFVLAQALPRKGDRVYSLGNPFDLAMTIIEGTHNGLVDGARYDQYLFSGSLNSGMSGGPALNAEGEVIGINVAKGEEQISFLVPAHHIVALLASEKALEPSQYQSHMAMAVKTHLAAYYDKVLSASWPVHLLGGYRYPDALNDSIKCWGHTIEKGKSLFDEVHRHCQTQDMIYLNDTLSVGHFSYDLGSITADGLNRFQFYNLLAENFSVSGFQYADETEVTPGACLDDYVQVEVMTWRVSTCVRQYKRIPGLYDAELVAQRIDLPLSSTRMSVSVAGIGRDQMQALHRRFLEQVRWEK
ncbi:MAG: serine protease [Gammaproteobacteria bacterium]